MVRAISPVSAAVVSTFKRVVVIAAAVVYFRTPITLPHACGIGIAILGVALFQERHRTPAELLRIIDLPKVAATPKGADGAHKRLDHRVPWVAGSYEDGYLTGLDNMIEMFEELLADEHLGTAAAHGH